MVARKDPNRIGQEVRDPDENKGSRVNGCKFGLRRVNQLWSEKLALPVRGNSPRIPKDETTARGPPFMECGKSETLSKTESETVREACAYDPQSC